MSPVLAATLVAPHQLEVHEYPYPSALEPGAVLLRMLASGICGTDKHTFRGETEQYVGTEYERSTPFPIIQGHENVGVVADIGDGGALGFDGTPLSRGDRVVPAPNRACGHCHMCARGFPYFLCRNLENYGNSLTCAAAPHLFGGWSQFLYLKPGTAMFRVPEGLPDEIAVLTEIFAVTHSLERAARLPRPNGWRPGDAVAVIGAGALGLAHAVKASLMGAGHLYVIDPSARRRALAARLADAVALEPGEPIAAEIDLVVNATGFPGTYARAEAIVRDGGTIIEVGAFVDMGGETFNPASICGRSLALLGVGGEDLNVYEGTLALLDRHRRSIPLHEMVSHRFDVADAPAAMALALDADASAKVLITPGVVASGRVD
ncbi:MAG TPA: alcohol dehydrogenase catalytic domain-containing protein [Solirubrobacteraceae bacterium]|jgi:L-iditol 2-dehydrogenase|nr:alcohol dehydrogenase catalytic domain-containing protein [Solirubrobacteraceae bacterium]